MEKEKRMMEVSEAERQIVQLVRAVGYGQIIVTVKDNNAVHIEERKSIPIRNK